MTIGSNDLVPIGYAMVIGTQLTSITMLITATVAIALSLYWMPMENKLFLDMPFTEEEVWLALKDFHPTKAPGQDGCHASFYKEYWPVIGDDVTHIILGCLNGHMNIGNLNNTFLTLIPKTK